MKLAILTGGGDCPGLNNVIRAVIIQGIKKYGDEIFGYLYGWKGSINNLIKPLTLADAEGIFSQGGTILKSSRTNPYKVEDGSKKVLENLKLNKIDALIAVGGEDTCGVADKLYKDFKVPIVCVPKTIDNDLSATDQTFGFDTSISIICDALDRLHTTARSHDRVLVLEVMGRHAGWLAAMGGLAGGADYILIPEEKFDIDHVAKSVAKRKQEAGYAIVVVAEGAKFANEEVLKDQEKDAFGHVKLGGIGDRVAKAIEAKTGMETRASSLGHIQRGGSPTAYDRVLGTRYGLHAVDLIHDKKFGRMVSLQGNKITDVSVSEAVGTLKTLDKNFYEQIKIFFGDTIKAKAKV
ncbi:MAG: ATP-dependent 6-phosphofructokinase [Candidatus Melainabacteria bacterium]|nr:ATP-dependent 6-phosphofructokinase [Candidatus Melainabacteria bacterium]